MTAALVVALCVTIGPSGSPDYTTLVPPAPPPVINDTTDLTVWYGAEVPWSYTLGWFDPIVQCESRGQWHSHRDGMFQIIPSTWRAYGGLEYAPYAGEAEPVDQLLVAGRVLDGQGPRAWVCRGAA